MFQKYFGWDKTKVVVVALFIFVCGAELASSKVAKKQQTRYKVALDLAFDKDRDDR